MVFVGPPRNFLTFFGPKLVFRSPRIARYIPALHFYRKFQSTAMPKIFILLEKRSSIREGTQNVQFLTLVLAHKYNFSPATTFDPR